MLGRFGSVRARTTVAATIALGVTTVAGALVMMALLGRAQQAGVQGPLEQRAGQVAAMARGGTLPDRLSFPEEPGALVQVVDAKDRVIAASAALEGRAPIGHVDDPRLGVLSAWTERLTSDDETYRVVGLTERTASGPVRVFAAASLEAVSDRMTGLQIELAVGLPLVLALVALISWRVVGRALRPVESIRAQVAEIGGSGRIDRRVPEPAGRDEVWRLARTMNEMLQRLQAAAERQRRFVADASHELRSPLASLRTQLEVSRDYPARRVGAVDDQLAEVERMERLVGDLLLLAKADERRLVVRSSPVDLREVVLDEVERAGSRARVRLDTAGVAAATVHGDREELARVVRNLLDNAVRFARARVELSLAERDGHVELSVADDGPGVPAAARERVFERFGRLDEGRARDAGGTGLGLAIVREVVVAHGGSVTVDGAPGARFLISLPRSVSGSR
jgi:signal transduction histidine kinase